METKMPAGVPDPWMKEITGALQQALAGRECRVYLFGSRARREAGERSDIDIAVECDGDADGPLAHARELIEETTVPVSVDLVDLALAPPELVRDVREQGVLIWAS